MPGFVPATGLESGSALRANLEESSISWSDCAAPDKSNRMAASSFGKEQRVLMILRQLMVNEFHCVGRENHLRMSAGNAKNGVVRSQFREDVKRIVLLWRA